MGRFADRARELFDAALSADASTNTAILIAPDGGLRIVSDSDWPLDSLALHHGAATAYRVTSHRGHVRVEGREGSQRCVLESQGVACGAGFSRPASGQPAAGLRPGVLNRPFSRLS